MKIRLLLLIIVLLPGGLVNAAVQSGFTTIQGTIIDSENFGGCMALLESMPAGLACPNNWVSFSCTGDYNPSSMGWRKYENAQIALLTSNRVRVYVDDAQLHNGNCFVRRLDMIP